MGANTVRRHFSRTSNKKFAGYMQKNIWNPDKRFLIASENYLRLSDIDIAFDAFTRLKILLTLQVASNKFYT